MGRLQPQRSWNQPENFSVAPRSKISNASSPSTPSTQGLQVRIAKFIAKMRLLYTRDTNTLRLEEFSPDRTPKYAILSHRWEEEEVTLQDVRNQTYAVMKGYSKIVGCCNRAVKDGYDWAWIDTCCIDKSSSAELSEAINSMYLWYQDSDVCYAYLSDIDYVGELKSSKWFSRGWTLQELIAPQVVVLFNQQWLKIGKKHEYGPRKAISSITMIPEDVLLGKSLLQCNVAQRMSWAAMRETTREEDMAYCLMGLFDVHMPPIYGEGSEKAFLRLQEEIIKQNSDQTLFLWSVKHEPYNLGLLATSPKSFCNHYDCFRWFVGIELPEFAKFHAYSFLQPLSTVPGSVKLEVSGDFTLGPPMIPDAVSFGARGLQISLLCYEGEQVPETKYTRSTIVCLDVLVQHRKTLGRIYIILTPEDNTNEHALFQGRLGAVRRHVCLDPRSQPLTTLRIPLERTKISVSQVHKLVPSSLTKFYIRTSLMEIIKDVMVFDGETWKTLDRKGNTFECLGGVCFFPALCTCDQGLNTIETIILAFGTRGKSLDPWCRFASATAATVEDSSIVEKYSHLELLKGRCGERASQTQKCGHKLWADMRHSDGRRGNGLKGGVHEIYIHY